METNSENPRISSFLSLQPFVPARLRFAPRPGTRLKICQHDYAGSLKLFWALVLATDISNRFSILQTLPLGTIYNYV